MKTMKFISSGIAMLLLFCSITARSQEKKIANELITITGKVVDDTGLPLPGVTIIVKGTKQGTMTDLDGKYTLTTAKGRQLEFSYVGFKPVTVTVGSKKVIDVVMKSNSDALQEVVIQGYSETDDGYVNYSTQAKPARGKIKDKKNEAMAKVMIRGMAPAQALQGIAPGIAIQRDKNTWGRIADTINPPSTDEDYGTFVENTFDSPSRNPLSTFSIDVDNASYTNIRRFINNGQQVPADAVRVEEMVNFFKYNYPQPAGEHPFSINTDYADCPWNLKHKLLRIGLQGRNISTESLPASNLVFLIDVSGSMNDVNKLPLLKESLKILVGQLRAEDKVALVVYAGAAGLVLPPTSGAEKETIINALNSLQSGGSTAGGAGIELAYKTAEANFIKGGNNRVILATDGDFNVGASSNTDMQTLIENKRKSGVFLTVLGYGMGNYKDSKMEILADKGNGNYAYIDNIQEANRFLGKEFKGAMYAIAKDVKIQIEMNPQHVQAYRLIGYENRKLRDEDFTNDTIDAGELGSGHTVTALYEIIPTGVESTFFDSKALPLKYSEVKPNTAKYTEELATVKFRYKKPDGDKSIEMVNVIADKPVNLDKTSDDFKFCASVAWFGLKLRDSKYVSDKSLDNIRKLAKSSIGKDDEGYKAEMVRLIDAMKAI